MMLKDQSIIGFGIFLCIYLAIIIFNLYLFYLFLFRKRKISLKIFILIMFLINFIIFIFYTGTFIDFVNELDKGEIVLNLLRTKIIVIVNYLIIYTGILIILAYKEYQLNKDILTNKLKDGLYLNPLIGVSYSLLNGKIIYSNKIMDDLIFDLTGEVNINSIKAYNNLEKHFKNSFFGYPEVVSSKGLIYEVIKEEKTISGIKLWEILLIDSTKMCKEYFYLINQNKELDEFNVNFKKKLQELKERKRAESLNLVKNSLHKEFGEALILAEAYVQDLYKDDPNLIIDNFKTITNNILLKKVNMPKFNIDEIYQAADSVGIKLELSGKLPEDKNYFMFFYKTSVECLINAYKHAEASYLKIKINQEDDFICFTYSNDGKIPTQINSYGGGLSMIKDEVKKLNGRMEIILTEEFILKIWIKINRRKIV